MDGWMVIRAGFLCALCLYRKPILEREAGEIGREGEVLE